LSIFFPSIIELCIRVVYMWEEWNAFNLIKFCYSLGDRYRYRTYRYVRIHVLKVALEILKKPHLKNLNCCFFSSVFLLFFVAGRKRTT